MNSYQLNYNDPLHYSIQLLGVHKPDSNALCVAMIILYMYLHSLGKIVLVTSASYDTIQFAKNAFGAMYRSFVYSYKRCSLIVRFKHFIYKNILPLIRDEALHSYEHQSVLVFSVDTSSENFEFHNDKNFFILKSEKVYY